MDKKENNEEVNNKRAKDSPPPSPPEPGPLANDNNNEVRVSWKSMAGIFIIIAVVSVVLNAYLFMQPSGTMTGQITVAKAGNAVIDYIEDLPQMQGANVSILNAETMDSGVYEIRLNMQGRELVSYITKDGKMLFPQGIDLTTVEEGPSTTQPSQQQGPSVPEADRPEVELFVMSYCPFGTMAEKGMIPVATLLGDKIDFNIRFVDYAMHDKKEIDENLRQYCIQEEQNDKFIDYLTCFLEDGKYEACLNEGDIDTQGLDACMARVDEEFNITGKFNDKSTWSGGRFPPFDVHADLNDKYGVRGSPTLVINGKQVQSGRAPANYLNNICSAFTTQPEECNEQLSSKTPSRGFGISETGSGGSGGSCG